jgi:hypothetical protein
VWAGAKRCRCRLTHKEEKSERQQSKHQFKERWSKNEWRSSRKGLGGAHGSRVRRGQTLNPKPCHGSRFECLNSFVRQSMCCNGSGYPQLSAASLNVRGNQQPRTPSIVHGIRPENNQVAEGEHPNMKKKLVLPCVAPKATMALMAPVAPMPPSNPLSLVRYRTVPYRYHTTIPYGIPYRTVSHGTVP